MRRVVTSIVWTAWLAGLVASPASAQPREPLGGVIADLRVVSSTLPTSVGWAVPAPTPGSLVPTRGLGGEVGAHVLLGPGRFRRLSLGATGLLAEGRSTGVDAPTIATRLSVVAPHLGMNFGHRDGWSYLSIGAGLASVQSKVKDTTAAADPTDWGTAFHYGGGARWFLREHIALSLDLRFWALTPRAATPTRVKGAATTRFAFGAGLSFR